MNELKLIDTVEAHLQTILQQQGLHRIWGEKPNIYIVNGSNLQECFHEVIQRVWFQMLGGVNYRTLWHAEAFPFARLHPAGVRRVFR